MTVSTLYDDVMALRASAARFRDSVPGLTEPMVRAASLLPPGWSRGQVLTHVRGRPTLAPAGVPYTRMACTIAVARRVFISDDRVRRGHERRRAPPA